MSLIWLKIWIYPLKPCTNGHNRVFEGEDITQELRLEETGALASKSKAAIPSVRAALLTRQKQFAKAPGSSGRRQGYGNKSVS